MSKRRRLQELVGIKGVSDAALSAILQEVRREPVEGDASRRVCNTAARAAIRDVEVCVDLPLIKGGTAKWTFLHPLRLLRKCLDESPQLRSAYKSALLERPNSMASPWGLILYFDELVPGNVLRLDNKRKTMSVYMSFMQLGHERLSKTEFWFTLAVARANVIRAIDGGWSNMYRILLRSLFFGSQQFRKGHHVVY